jgi:plastocyanin
MTTRLSLRLHAPAVAVTLVVVSLGIAACFSERSTSNTTVSGTNCTVPTTAAGAAVVFIRGFKFETPTVHVKSGASVAWVNCEPDATPHTSTSDAGAWNSGSLVTPASFSRAFSTVGTFAYHCDIHPSMKATVIVE